MFEKVIESVLEEYVSEWVEGLESEKMKVALFAGKVEFRDLRMRGAALDKFQLPMKMKSGSVGKLSMKVPWKKLTSQAVTIKIEDVVLVLEPTDPDEVKTMEEDDDTYVLRTRWAKQQEVRMFELLETAKHDENVSNSSEHEDDPGVVDLDPTASWSYRKKIINTIMDNVSFELTNIHIRFEDSKNLVSSIPLALGLTIDSILIMTTNANGQAAFVDRAQTRTAFVHRSLEMVQASVYGDYFELTEVTVRKGPSASGSNIVHPFSTRINLARNHDERSASAIPKLRCSTEISAVRACVTPEQSTFLISIANFVSAHEMYLKRLHYQRKRPTVPVRSDARLWWQYAVRGVTELRTGSISDKKTSTAVSSKNLLRKASVVTRRCNWKLFATLWCTRKTYIYLHKNMLRAAKKKKMDVESVMADRNRLNELEDRLEVSTIVFFRLCAKRELEIESQGHDSLRKLPQWKSKWTSGRTASKNVNGGASTGRESFFDKIDLYLAVNDRMHASLEARTTSISDERTVEALVMALDLVVTSFEVVLVEDYKIGDKSDTRDFLRFELSEFVVTVLQRTSSSTVSSRIKSIQVLDFRQTYEVTSTESKEPQALLSMIGAASTKGQVAARKNPFVELNIESSESKLQLECAFEKFRYIHNLYATSKLRAYFIQRKCDAEVLVPTKAEALSPPKLTRKAARLSVESLQNKSTGDVFGGFGITKSRRSSASVRAMYARAVSFSVKLPEIDIVAHTADNAAEVEIRLLGTHFQNGEALNTFEILIEGAEAYFLDPQTLSAGGGHDEATHRNRSTLMQSSSLTFYGRKLLEGYLIPKWEMKCTSPPIHFLMSNKQYQQLLHASSKWSGRNFEPRNDKVGGKAAVFVAEDERLNIGIAIPQILVNFKCDGIAHEALKAASTPPEEITGFQLDIRDLNVIARFSSVAQAATVDMSALSLIKSVTHNLANGKADASSLDTANHNVSGIAEVSVAPPMAIPTDTAIFVYDPVTGCRNSKLLELRGRTSLVVSSSTPLIGEIKVEQAALYWDHELFVAIARYHLSTQISKQSSSVVAETGMVSISTNPLPVFPYSWFIQAQRWSIFFMPKACQQEHIAFAFCGTNLHGNISTFDTEYVRAELDSLGDIQLTSSRRIRCKSATDIEFERSPSENYEEVKHVLLHAYAPIRVLLESAGFESLKHRGGAGVYYYIEGNEVQVTYLHLYWSFFLNHIMKEVAGFSRWMDLLRMPAVMQPLNERLSVELKIAHLRLILPTFETQDHPTTPWDYLELDLRDISSVSRAYPENTLHEQCGAQIKIVKVIAVMTEPKGPRQMTNDKEASTLEPVVQNFCLGSLHDVFVEHVAIPIELSDMKIVKKNTVSDTESSVVDFEAVVEEMEKMRSYITVTLSSSTNWSNTVTSDGLNEDLNANGFCESNGSEFTTNLAFNSYQLELLSRISENNFASSSTCVVRSYSNADELIVKNLTLHLGNLALDILDPLDTSNENASGDQASSGMTIARICLENVHVKVNNYASLRSQVCLSIFKGALWKVDHSEDGIPASTANNMNSEVRTFCGCIFSSSADSYSRQGIDLALNRCAPLSGATNVPTDIRIHFDTCEFLPEIFEFGQRLRYIASIVSEPTDITGGRETSLDVSVTTGFVYYLAAEYAPDVSDEYESKVEASRLSNVNDIVLRMIASGCIVLRYHSENSENSRTQVYGRNMSVKVSSEWPPQAALTPLSSPHGDLTVRNEMEVTSQSGYERTVCDDFTFDIELITAEDAEATVAVNFTHFHIVICTIDLFLLSQAKKILGTDDDVKSVIRETNENDGGSEEEMTNNKRFERALAPPEIEFREDSISMVQLLLEDTSLTLLRQSGPHMSPIARLYTFRAMCKVTYEVGERINGVVPTLTEVAVKFPDESLNEPNADDGISVWGFNTALGSWEPFVEPWMFDLTGSLIRDETGEVTANLNFTGKEGHPLNINMSPAMINSFCQTAIAYDNILHTSQRVCVKSSNVISSDCYLVNDSGAPITYWVTHDIGNASRGFTYAALRQPKREWLLNQAKVALELLTSISPSLHAEQTVSFCLDDKGWYPLTDIPIRNTGKYIYGVRPRCIERIIDNGSEKKGDAQTIDTVASNSPQPQLLHILLDVTAASGCRTFTISSLVRLFNETSIAVDFGVLEADGKTITDVGTIEPKGACSVPFRFVTKIWSVRVFIKPHLDQWHTRSIESNESEVFGESPSTERVHRWSNELFICEKEKSTLYTASCSLVLDDYACKCPKMISGTVPFHPSQVCKANGSYFHAQSRVFTSSNASSLQYAQLKLTSPLTLVNKCGVPIVAVLFALKQVRRTGGTSEDVHIVSSHVIPPRGRVDTFSSALQDETFCSISMTGSSWSRLFRVPGVSDLLEGTKKNATRAATREAISSYPSKIGTESKSVVLSLLDFQSRTATLNVSFDTEETREQNAGHYMIVQPRYLLRNATSLPLLFFPQEKLIEKIPGSKSMMARFTRSPFSPSRTKQSHECCGSAEQEAIHAKLNALQGVKVSDDVIDENELQAQYYSEVSAIMVQLEGNTQQSSSAQDISLEVGANTALRVYSEATKRYHDLVAVFRQVGGSRSMEVTFVERYLLLNHTDHVLLAAAVCDIAAAKKDLADGKKILAAPPRSSSEFSWSAHSSIPSDSCIRLKIQSVSDQQIEDYQWSGKFSLHDVSETALKNSTPDASRICVLRVQVRIEAAVQVLIVVTSEDAADFPLYRIINSCARETICFKQIFDGVKKDASALQRGVMQSLAPGQRVCFGWDEAFFLGTPNREISVWYAPNKGTTSSDYHSTILLDQPGESQQVEIPSKDALPNAPSRVYIRWHLQGVTKTMVAQDIPLNKREKAGKQTRQLVAAHGESERSTTSCFSSEVIAHFRLPHFGVSFITSMPDELLFFSGQDVDIAYANINDDHDQCEVKIGCFQLDNQLREAIYPVIIAPIVKKGSGCAGFRDDATGFNKEKCTEVRSAHATDPFSSGDDGESGDKLDTKKSGSKASAVIRPHFFHLSILRLSYDANMDYIKYFSAMMQPARIQIDEAFLLALASFVTNCLDVLETNYPSERRRRPSEALEVYSMSSYNRFKANSERRIYIETLQLHPVKIQLSVTILNHYGETEESVTGLASLVKLPLAVTKAILSSTFSQIDSATLYLNALHLNHAFASGSFLMSTVHQHYMLQGMRQIYSLIGAADILGNPVGLVTNLGIGVKDFFYEPAAGLVTSPQDFIIGLSRGTTSLFTHSLYGAFNAASKVTGTLSEGIATLSLDRKYLAERRAQEPRQQVATHIGTGLIHGTKRLGKGIFAGVTGVITAPTQGAIHGGVPGFIEGVGKGLIGVAVKPAAGVLDLAATTAAGITATTSALDRRTGLGKEVYRRREPRLLRVTSDQRVRVYTSAEALVSRLLLTLPTKYKLQFPNELYDAHFFLPGARILVATSLRLLLLEFASGGTFASLTTAIMSSTSIPSPSVLWSYPLSKLVGAQRTPTGIAAHLGTSAFDAELSDSSASERTYDDVATLTLSGLEELGASGTDRVQGFLADLAVRHRRATATSYGTE